MTTNPLSQAQTARLLAAECYRLKSEQTSLDGERGILQDLRKAERRVHEAARTTPAWQHYSETARSHELNHEIAAVLAKSNDVSDQLVRLGNEGLSQASFSALGTMNPLERSTITHALEPQEFKDGAVLIKQGEPRDALLIIVQGQVSCAQRPGLDETVFKRDCLLTSQSCEFTVTAVGEVKVLVLHGARKLLADCCATKSTKLVATKLVAPSRLAAARLGPDAPLDPSTQLRQRRGAR